MGIATEERLSFVIRKIIGKIGVDFDCWYNTKTANAFFQPILIIHGMFAASWCFDSWARFLCDKGFAVYVIKDLHEGEDLRKVDFYTYVEKSTKVVEEICAMGKNKIIILGHSMGGLIAQKIAEMKPQLIAGLVLVASTPPKGISMMSFEIFKAMFKQLFSLTSNLPLQIDRKSTFKLILNWLGDEDRKEQIFKKFVSESSIVAKQLAFSNIPVDHRKIVCKSLVVAGTYDKLLPLETQIEIAQRYDSDYRSFLNGHMMMLEDRRDKIIGAIYEWINLNLIY